jgi:hypothetical protein
MEDILQQLSQLVNSGQLGQGLSPEQSIRQQGYHRGQKVDPGYLQELLRMKEIEDQGFSRGQTLPPELLEALIQSVGTRPVQLEELQKLLGKPLGQSIRQQDYYQGEPVDVQQLMQQRQSPLEQLKQLMDSGALGRK